MELKQLFDSWGAAADKKYAQKQWLLSKWEINEGIDWPAEKTELLVRHLRDALKLTGVERFIDLGCGGGWILERLRPFTKESYGLDFSWPMIQFAADSLNGNLICGEIGRLPFADETVDRLLSNYVFMNFADDGYVEGSLKEIYRVLKKGGRALIGQLPDRNGSADYELAKEAYQRYVREEFPVGRSIRDVFKPPLRLFERARVAAWLTKCKIAHHFQDSFNPFYHGREPLTVPWRFDLVISK